MLGWIRTLMNGEEELQSLLLKAEQEESLDRKAEIYGELADEGVRQALEGIAMLAYKNRRWAAMNAKKIEVWLRKGTKKEIPWCQLVLGWLYEEGLGVSKDPEEALFRYEQTARMDLADGFFRLGILALRGTLRTRRDPYKAALYFYQAEQMNHAESARYLDIMENWEIISRRNLEGKLEGLLERELTSASTPWRNGLDAPEDMDGLLLPQDEDESLLYESRNALLQKVDAGDPKALCRLGVLYLFGDDGFPQDLEKAVEAFGESAKRGVIEAQTNLAALYMTGKGVTQDFAKARALLEVAVEKNDSFAMGKLGEIYAEGIGVTADLSKGIHWYQRAVENGDVRSMVNLGLRYWEGRGVQANQNRAMTLFKMASDKGDMEGINYLARALLDQPDPKKHEEGVYWLRESAKKGHVLSMFLLARCYEKGRGIKKDDKEAYTWYLFAARRNYLNAKIELGKMVAKERATAPSAAEEKEWLQEAALEGDLQACFKLGQHYLYGTNSVIDTDYSEALRLLTRAAEKNLSDAQMLLYHMYEYAKGVDRDESKAQYWLKQAISNGNAEASYIYGSELLDKGQENEAVRNLMYAADRRYFPAADKLGDIFSKQKKYEKARFWYENALEGKDMDEREITEKINKLPQESLV